MGKVLILSCQSKFMKAGSIASNPNKLKIMNLLAKKDLSLERIVKATRLPQISVKSIMDELVKDGFVEEKDGIYSATEEGKKALKTLKV